MDDELEKLLSRFRDVTHILGIDESGTGAWAGPFYLSAVLGPVRWTKQGVRDSKKTTAGHRSRMIEVIEDDLDIVHAEASAFPDDITKFGHAGAYLRAYTKCISDTVALCTVAKKNILVVMDGSRIRSLQTAANTLGFLNILFVVKADGRVPHVGAASIFAKFNRDVEMNLLDKKFPGYYFNDHAGYGTTRHREALEAHGPIPHVHRHLKLKKKRTGT